LAGNPIDPRTPLDAQSLGISTVYQEVNLIPYLSVAENIFLGRQPRRLGKIDWRSMNSQSAESLEALDLSLDVTKPLNAYPIAVQQMVAIARALDVDAKVLVLDEPTSSLDAREVDNLFAVMAKLKASGLGIVFVSHFLDQVYRIADRFTVLRNGSLVGSYEAAALPRIELISKMIGKDVAEVEEMTRAGRRQGGTEAGESVLEADGIGRRGSVEGLSVTLRKGEVVGLAGLLGSGRTESAKLLFGVDRTETGAIKVRGKPVRMRSPREALGHRMGMCPEDRKTEAIIPNLSVRENVALALQASRGWIRRLSPAKQRELAERFVAALNIATPDIEKAVGELSGGNQQKVVVARWLASQPEVLILDEPTRGIDVGAKAEIEKLAASLCSEGVAILFISSEIDEVVRASHRVIVLRDRRVVGELVGEEIDPQAIMQVIAGGTRE
jgi:simple sugar transport system ATP-binding protein